MIKRVLVPLDGSRLAEAPLDFAARLLRPVRGTLILLHAVTPSESFAVPARQFLRGERRRAAAYLDRLAGRLETGEIGVLPRVVSGEASSAIAAAARKERADLMAMTLSGKTRRDRLFFGSVAEEVLRKADRPLLLVRGRIAR